MTETNQNKLTKEDIANLASHPDANTKIGVIEKLSNQYNGKGFTAEQLKLAEDIFRLLVKQAEVEVRKALSENLMTNKNIPHDVVLSLAKDVDEVSAPVLEFSDVLTDDDLTEIIKSTEKTASLLAISGRQSVSKAVSGALVDKENSEVVENLLENTGAQISEASYEKVVVDNPNSEKIAESMLMRSSLPENVVNLMISTVSSAISQKLETKYKKSFKDINQFFTQSAEIAALKFKETAPVDDDLIQVVDNLEASGKLEEALDPSHGMLTQLLDGLEQMGHITPISALQAGHLTLFESMIARITGVPLSNVQKLVHDSDGGLKALYERAQLPPSLYEMVSFVTRIILEMNTRAKENNDPKAHHNLHLLIKNIISLSKKNRIPNLGHFVSVMRDHLEKKQSEW